ncbi:DNA cytosine methyltransferase [Salininema proteolyticum]|uniref:DNA (cytosine-5-)-methyltransferase n=1 Tax=Salininema proteolyticum TaxID=1607685 RepID=A0ABV8U035_9ACTN
MLRIGSLFTGIAGLDLGLAAAVEAETAWCAENDSRASMVLAHRFPEVPNLGNVREIDWAGAEPVDVIAGGFPCQDVSVAGARAGIAEGTRSGLWGEMVRAVEALRPGFVVIENVRGLLSADGHVRVMGRAEGTVDGRRPSAFQVLVADLAALGYDAQWICLGADEFGAPHRRERIFVLGRDRSRPASAADADGDTERHEPVLVDRATRQVAGGKADAVPAAVGGGSGSGFWPGRYRDTIAQWERVIGRPAPDPSAVLRGKRVLNPRLIEWMMGFGDGWVTDVPGLSQTAQFRLLGNSVVPLQAETILRRLFRWSAIDPKPHPDPEGVGGGVE